MNKKNFLTKKEIKTFWLAAAVANLLFLGAAILQINAYIHQNSLVKDYQKQITAVSRENDRLEVALAQSDSLENFDPGRIARADNYEKVSVDAIKYVRISSNQLVLR